MCLCHIECDLVVGGHQLRVIAPGTIERTTPCRVAMQAHEVGIGLPIVPVYTKRPVATWAVEAIGLVLALI